MATRTPIRVTTDQHSSQSTGNRRRNGPTRSILREFEGPTFSVDEGGDILANGGSQHSYSLRYHEALCDSCLPRRNQPHELVQLDDCAARGRGDCPSADFLVHHRGRGASSQHPQPRRRPAKSGEVPVESMRLPNHSEPQHLRHTAGILTGPSQLPRHAVCLSSCEGPVKIPAAARRCCGSNRFWGSAPERRLSSLKN